MIKKTGSYQYEISVLTPGTDYLLLVDDLR